MSRAHVAVLQIVSKQLTVTAAAAEYGISRRHLHRLLARYRDGGLDALEPRSRRPKTTPIATPETVRQRVIELRAQLTADGLDAGPETIRWHLEREGLRAPSTSTIRRILHGAGLISPEPRKRPRSSYTRFEMAQPNEMWQSDFIHWRLADGTDAEILNWLDDHSRYLLSCTVHRPVTGDDVVSVFLGIIEEYDPPASTLTDNGSVYTSRFTGGRNAFEYVLPLLSIRQKTGPPATPRPKARPNASTRRCNAGSRPDDRHEPSPSSSSSSISSASTTTSAAPTAPFSEEPQATPTAPPQKPAPASNGHASGHYRLRYDRLDPKGKMTIRRAGRMHHLGVGTAHARKRVLAFADDHRITVAELTTGRGPLRSSDQAEQDLLAQPKHRARPLAELSELRPMSRLI